MTQGQPPLIKRPGFTLVEILVVIVIIGLLAALGIPAAVGALERARVTSMKMEVTGLETAITQYQQKYGDYPPDFSNWAVVERHYRKIFPRIATGELARLRMLVDDDPDNDTNVSPPSPWEPHDPTRMDRAEALVWALGGFSTNPQTPFTGPGGPLALVSSTGTATIYEINIDRENKFFDFDPARLNFSDINPGATRSLTNRYVSLDEPATATEPLDLFLTYAAKEGQAPFVYFDSRTYADASSGVDFNGYFRTDLGAVRPYISDQVNNVTISPYGSLATAMTVWQFMKPNTFQLIAPGPDGVFGSTASFDFQTGGSLEPVYFQYPTGAAMSPSTAATAPSGLIYSGVDSYDESSTFGQVETFQQDNITNFSNGKLVDDVEI